MIDFYARANWGDFEVIFLGITFLMSPLIMPLARALSPVRFTLRTKGRHS